MAELLNLTVSQKEVLVDQSIRQVDSSWLLRGLRPAAGHVRLSSLGIELNFADLYDKVEFNP